MQLTSAMAGAVAGNAQDGERGPCHLTPRPWKSLVPLSMIVLNWPTPEWPSIRDDRALSIVEERLPNNPAFASKQEE